MIILFLDFDGVLHAIGQQVFNPDTLDRVADAIEAHDVEIVISSSWRLNQRYDLERMREFVGPRLGPKVRGMTPYISDQYLKYCRHYECQRYLEEEGLTDHPWVAIDDEKGCFPPDAPVVLTNCRKGFWSEDVETLNQLLREVSKGRTR